MGLPGDSALGKPGVGDLFFATTINEDATADVDFG
jgi:hypothetical protein